MGNISLYYNENGVYYIIPQVLAKDIPVWISISPREQVASNAGVEELGLAIQRALYTSENSEAPTLAEGEKCEYWKELGYKSFSAFSKKHTAIELECGREKTVLTKMLRDSKGAYVDSRNEEDTCILNGLVSVLDMAITVNKMLGVNVENDKCEKNENNEKKTIITLGKNIIEYVAPSDELEDCGDGGTDAYQIYSEADTDNYIAFLIDNGYKALNKKEIKTVLERQFGEFRAFDYDDTNAKNLVIRGSNDECIVESVILIFEDESVEILLYEKTDKTSVIEDEYHKLVGSIMRK